MSQRAALRRLLHADTPLILAGVHDGLSARIAERAGFRGLWASGFCISASKCLPDVGLLSMHEHLAATAAIHAASELPVIADVDDGFGDAINVVRTVREYEAAGVAGVCLEDNQHPKRNSLYAGLDRQLVSSDAFARKIEAAVATRRESGTPGAGPAVAWLRTLHPLVGDEPISPLQRVLLAADAINGVGANLDMARYSFVNADLSVYLHRLPDGPWIRLAAAPHPQPHGVGLVLAELGDTRGPIGHALEAQVITTREAPLPAANE